MDIYVISGFLGSGKTTLINQMIKNLFQQEKVVLIENDFGNINVDSSLVLGDGIIVSSLQSGCICCSLSGDFVSSLQQVIKTFKPTVVLVEPSGVGSLSDIIDSCQRAPIAQLGQLKKAITVVDGQRCIRYMRNFGVFYQNQISYADLIVVNRLEETDDQGKACLQLIHHLNGHASVLVEPLAYLPWEMFVTGSHFTPLLQHRQTGLLDNLQAITKQSLAITTRQQLETCLRTIIDQQPTLIRMKGFVLTTSGCVLIQYVYADLKIVPTLKTENSLGICFIGSALNEDMINQELSKL